MKKIYLMATLLGAASFAFGQVQTKAVAKLNTAPLKSISQTGTQKDAGGVIWHENFDNITTYDEDGDITTSIPSDGFWTITGSETLENGYGWEIGTTDYSWSGIGDAFNSSSGGAYAQINNGNPNSSTQEMGVIYTLESGSIDLSALTGETDLMLTFEQFGAKFNDDQFLEVSVDGGQAWTRVYDHGDKDALSATGGDYYPNPDLIEIALGDLFEGETLDDVRLRFTWTSFPQFDQSNPMVWVTYGWVIDDIKFTTKSDYDLVYTSSDWDVDELQYSIIPQSQIEAMTFNFSANFKNQGTEELTNVKLHLLMDGDTLVSSNGITLEAGDKDSISISHQFGDELGLKELKLALTTEETDDNPGNNQINRVIAFEVVEDAYAADKLELGADDIEYEMQLELTSGPMVFDKVALVYEVYETIEVHSVDVKFYGGADEGEVAVGIADYESSQMIAETEPADLLSSHVGVNNVFNGVFDAPVTLTPGTYLVYVTTFENTDITLIAAGEISNPQQVVFNHDASGGGLVITNYYLTPAIRLNMDPTVSVATNALNTLELTQFPNPFANETTISFSLEEAANVSYEVVDMTGKVVANASAGQMMAGAHEITIDGSSFANGIYYLNLTAGDAVVTHKMVVNK